MSLAVAKAIVETARALPQERTGSRGPAFYGLLRQNAVRTRSDRAIQDAVRSRAFTPACGRSIGTGMPVKAGGLLYRYASFLPGCKKPKESRPGGRLFVLSAVL